MSKFPITTQAAIRESFWDSWKLANPTSSQGPKRGKTQNQYPADVRQHFCDHVEFLQRHDCISEALADRATL